MRCQPTLLDTGLTIVVLTMVGVIPLVLPVPAHRYEGDGMECRECGRFRGHGNHT